MTERFTTTAREAAKSAIVEAEGHEVLLVGRCDDTGRISEVEPVARGNSHSVGVPFEFCDRGDIIIHNHPSGNLEPSDADVSVSSNLAQRGIGSAIIDNECERIYVLVEPAIPSENVPLDLEFLESSLSDGGGLERVIDSFRPRRSQIEMVRRVGNAFNHSSVFAAEAGTGVGKSFAYLVPSILWAAQNGERVVVATATINLQEQLTNRDIPAVQKALGTNLPVTLVKGRGNYLCTRRLDEYVREPELIDARTELVDSLVEWARETESGSRSELPVYVPEEIWSQINSEVDLCSPARCENRDRCFILKARMEAARSKILVANHHLVFSDLAVRHAGFGWDQTAVLPPFRRIILDEAHNVERNATSFFSEAVSVSTIRRWLGRLDSRRGKKRFGLLEKLRELDADGDTIGDASQRIAELRDRAERINSVALLFLGDESTYRVTRSNQELFDAQLGPDLFSVQQAVLSVAEGCRAIGRTISEAHREHSFYFELQTMVKRFESIAAVWQRFQDPAYDDSVLWLERRGNRGSRTGAIVRFVVTPLDISSHLTEALFEQQDTVICTSATMAINGDFSYWSRQVGFPLDEENSGLFPSPFPYKSRVLLAIPRDAAEPTTESYDAYLSALIPRLIGRRGASLVLFTSHRMMNEMYDILKPELTDRGLTVYRQGEDDRTRLLENFRSDVSSILFATDSFWEGVDVPGDSLRLVVLTRLPFRVPTDPVYQARAEIADSAGGRSFTEIALPQAIMRLKQGFGRLMRRDDDYGVVVITDSRIATKWYGRLFVSSLPESRAVALPTDEVVSEVEAFLDRLESSS